MSRYADTIYRDPFVKPVRYEMGTEFREAMQAKLGENARGQLLVLYRTTTPINVIGTKDGPPCSACGHACWVAPSSAAILPNSDVIPVCMTCVEAVLMKLEAER